MIAGSQTLEEMVALGMKIKPVHTTGDEVGGGDPR